MKASLSIDGSKTKTLIPLINLITLKLICPLHLDINTAPLSLMMISFIDESLKINDESKQHLYSLLYLIANSSCVNQSYVVKHTAELYSLTL